MSRCDVCSSTDNVEVYASTMGANSFAYCNRCLKEGLEPYGAMVVYIASAGKYPEGISEIYVNKVKRVLQGLNVTEEQFIKDTERCFHDM